MGHVLNPQASYPELQRLESERGQPLAGPGRKSTGLLDRSVTHKADAALRPTPITPANNLPAPKTAFAAVPVPAADTSQGATGSIEKALMENKSLHAMIRKLTQQLEMMTVRLWRRHRRLDRSVSL